MSDNVTLELSTELSKPEIKTHLSELWHGEAIEVEEAISKGMTCLVVLNYYFHSKAMQRPAQDDEVLDAMQWLLSISSEGYIYYYRNSSTAEYARFSPLVLTPEEALRDFPPRMLSGVQERYVVVVDKKELSNAPPVESLAKWRLGCRSRVSPRDLAGRPGDSFSRLGGVEVIEDKTHDTVVVEWTSRQAESPEVALGVLEALGEVTSDGLVYYYPSTVDPERVETFQEVIEPQELFMDDFRLEAERTGRFRYPIHIAGRTRFWYSP